MGDHVHYLNRLGRLVNERKAKWTCKPQEKIEIGFSSDTANTQQIKQDFNKSCQI